MNCTACGIHLHNHLDTWGDADIPFCFDCYWEMVEDRPSEIKAMLAEEDFGDLQRREWEQRGL